MKKITNQYLTKEILKQKTSKNMESKNGLFLQKNY